MAQCIHAAEIELVIALLCSQRIATALAAAHCGTEQCARGCAGTQIASIGDDSTCDSTEGPPCNRPAYGGICCGLLGATPAAGLQGLGTTVGIIQLKLLQGPGGSGHGIPCRACRGSGTGRQT